MDLRQWFPIYKNAGESSRAVVTGKNSLNFWMKYDRLVSRDFSNYHLVSVLCLHDSVLLHTAARHIYFLLLLLFLLSK